MALVASVRGYPPPVAVEFARKLLFSDVRPTFNDLEAQLKGKSTRQHRQGGREHGRRGERQQTPDHHRQALQERRRRRITAARGKWRTPTS